MHILTHSVINTDARTTTTDGGRRCSRWLTHYRQRVTERSEEDDAAAAANGRQPVYLLRSLCTLPLGQPYWFIALVCLVFWQFTVMWRHLHALFMENLLSQGEKQKWNCGQSNLCILNTKFPKWLISSVLPPPFSIFIVALSDYSIWQSACVKRANEYK